MKNLLTIFTLVFTLMFSSTSFAEWLRMAENMEGDSFYVDFERIRKVDGYVYFWVLSDWLKPSPGGFLSDKRYQQVDCKLFRTKLLSLSNHPQSMGRGVGTTHTLKNPDWEYPAPDSVEEFLLELVCNH